METNKLKKLFSLIAMKYGFKKAYGSYYKESEDIIVSLNLFRSYYSILYYLDINIYVKAAYNNGHYTLSKDLLKGYLSGLFTRPPSNMTNVLDLENLMTDESREKGLNDLFVDFINPFVEKALTKEGIKFLITEGVLMEFPSIIKVL